MAGEGGPGAAFAARAAVSEQTRLPELDLLRAAALVGVGVIHAGAWVTPADAPSWTNAMAATSGLARFCVPAFVFASGFALFHTYGDRRVHTAEFLKRRWLRVLLPWLSCVPLFLVLDWQRGDTGEDPASVGRWLAFGPGHLYFLILVAQLYLVFLVLPRDTRRLRWAAAALVAAQLGLMAWRTYGPLPGGALTGVGVLASPEEAPFWAGTFALGCLASAEWPRLARLARFWPLAVLATIASGALLLGEGRLLSDQVREGSSAYFWPSRLPQTLAWSLALLWLGRRWAGQIGKAPLIGELSRHSLGVYLLHPAFLDALGPASNGVPPALRVPLLLVVSFAGAYLAVRLLSLTQLTALMVGEAPPRNYLVPQTVYVDVTNRRQRVGEIIRSR